MKLKFFMRINKSFSAKVFTYLLGAMILVTATYTYFFLHFQQKYLENEIIKDGRVLTNISANNARLGIFAEDSRIISESLRTAINVEGVVGACAYDVEGQLLHRFAMPDWDQSEICRMAETMPLDFRNQLKKSSNVLHFENIKTIVFWSPVRAKPQKFTEEMLYFKDEGNGQFNKIHTIGFVGVVFDKGPVQNSIREILVKNFLILLFFLNIGCIASYYIVQGVTRPLNKLIASIKSHDLRVDSKDELDILSDTFSGMVETLSDSFGTINTLKKGLENKVHELEVEIIKRKQSESDLRENEEKFRNISEGIADGVAIIINGKFAWYNRAFGTIFGYESIELFDSEVKILLPQVHNMQNPIIDEELYLRDLIEVRNKKNQRILVEVNARKIFFEKQDAIQIIIRDITELDVAEKKRKELEVKALGQSKLASLGKIATSVAHEINQPLSYVKISYERMLRDIENQQFDQEEVKEYCIESLRQVDRINMITDHLRSFGRTDTSLFSEIQITDVIANSLTLMGESLRLADITLTQEIDENLSSTIGNSVQLEQVFINLFQNSVDALDECTKKKITINLQQVGEMIEILFSDTGPGISSDVIENMFEPFFTTKRLEDRTGLGLGIVNNIIKEHKGTIEYQKKVGWGATFLIRLPINE